MRSTFALLAVMAFTVPVAAQTRRVVPPPAASPSVSLRPFVVVSEQSFSAVDSFKALFGQSLQPFFGGGLDVAFRNGLYLDATASRFSKTGQRAFAFNGQLFGLGVPVTVTEIPLEFTVGYRHRTRRSWVVPYVGAGVGSYSYEETSEGNDSSENVNVRHVGYLGVAGAEFRLGRYVGLTGDVQYTHVPGILGTAGISQALNENDLGGIAVRFRVIVGR